MKRKNKCMQESDLTGNEWLTTYSDCITLLLTFFILLYSMSNVDESKVQKISQAFSLLSQGENSETILDTNLLTGEDSLIADEGTDAEEYINQFEKKQQTLYETITNFVNENDLENEVVITKTKEGIAMQLKDSILFETASANLNSTSAEILSKISTLIGQFTNNISVEGHTDNRPINTEKFKSNWELSSARAVNVVEYFVEEGNLKPERFSATGYGEFRPIASNDSDDNMAMNRRVNIIILNEN